MAAILENCQNFMKNKYMVISLLLMFTWIYNPIQVQPWLSKLHLLHNFFIRVNIPDFLSEDFMKMSAILDFPRLLDISYRLRTASIPNQKVDILSFPMRYHMSGADNFTPRPPPQNRLYLTLHNQMLGQSSFQPSKVVHPCEALLRKTLHPLEISCISILFTSKIQLIGEFVN